MREREQSRETTGKKILRGEVGEKVGFAWSQSAWCEQACDRCRGVISGTGTYLSCGSRGRGVKWFPVRRDIDMAYTSLGQVCGLVCNKRER